MSEHCLKPAIATAILAVALLGGSCAPSADEEDAHLCGDIRCDSLGTEARGLAGAKTILFLRVDFSDLTGEPISQSAAQTLIDSSVNAYIEAASYGQVSLTATVTPLLRMPRTKAYYAYSIARDDQLRSDALAAAAALDPAYAAANFDYDIVAFKHFPEWTTPSWAKQGYRGLWLNGYFGWPLVSHELGHNFGLPHAGTFETTGSIIGPGSGDEYGHPWDMMGKGGTAGTSMKVADHFNASFKHRLGWLSSGELQVVTSSGTHRLYAYETTIGSGLHALKIPRGDGAGRSHWVEFRQGQTTNALLMSGVSINRDTPTPFNAASLLLDMTPASSGGVSDSALVIGRTFSDWNAGIHVTPIGKGGTTPESIDVVVNLGEFPGNGPPTVAISASKTNLSSGTVVNFTATASDPDGDALAYHWDFGDGSFGPNAPAASHTYVGSAAELVARCTVSDRKGGIGRDSVILRVGSPSTHRISGTVTEGGRPLVGVRISDGTRSTLTDSDGTYTLVGVPAGTRTLTAVKYDYGFAPSSDTVSVSGNVTGRDFTATPNRYTVSGRVVLGTSGVSGVTVSDGTRSATSDANGNYVLTDVPNGFYTLTATKPGDRYSFTPFNGCSPGSPLEVQGRSLTTCSFRADRYALSGKVIGVSDGATAAQVTVTDGVRSTTGLFALGPTDWGYIINGVPPGSWTVTATLPGKTLAPANFTNPVTVDHSSVPGLDFIIVDGGTGADAGEPTDAGAGDGGGFDGGAEPDGGVEEGDGGTPADAGTTVDAGAGDGGSPGSDPEPDGGSPSLSEGPVSGGCGCGGAGDSLAWLGLLALTVPMRARRGR